MQQQFGELTVIKSEIRIKPRADRPNGVGRKLRFWLVRCSCGREFKISDRSLRTGSQKCKGCSHSGKNCSAFSHGSAIRGEETPEYRCWKSIKVRCYNSNYKQFPDYGGRGIRVCQRWLDSFENFLADMGQKPSHSYSIQRQDNDGDYSPENCYWATDKEQRRNKRTTYWVTINGKTQSLVDWFDELGVKKSTFYSRKKRGLSDIECLLGKN